MSSNFYWQNKIAAYLQESVVKVFDIRNRDEWAKQINESVGVTIEKADKLKIQQAAYIASGLTRAALPYDDSQLEKIILKHPLVKNTSIELDIQNVSISKLVKEIKDLLETDLAELTRDLSEEEKAKQIFYYLFFAFNKQLRKSDKEELSKVGAFWDILPADTRMPDHPMWHHFGMTSAIYSCLEKNSSSSDKNNLSLVVYSITPVQDFIGKARKLRDYWTGSVLLSYLAFSGITVVMEELGPDHILYPSLQNQSLVEQLIGKKSEKLKSWLAETDANLQKLNNDSKSIASFPNKFVFLCHNSEISEVCKKIEERIDSEWKTVCLVVKKYLAKETGSENSAEFNSLWDNAVDKFWKYSWAATNFATITNEKELNSLLSNDKWQNELEAMKKFDECFDERNNFFPDYDASNLYGTTHSLVQGLLAAGKMKPTSFKHIQTGEKCPLCGELSVLNNCEGDNKEFWKIIRSKVNPNGETLTIGDNERLCAVCAVKRFLPLGNVFNQKNHILYETLVSSYENFPSTTEMARWEIDAGKSSEERQKIAQKYHNGELAYEKNDEAGDGTEKYYAFLLMDGDKMGDLINGETTEACWNDVINLKDNKNTPFEDDNFARQRRTINPALHSMISDSLNNFARYGVQPAIAKNNGRLIYAGGDDVCAILPLTTAFCAADEIRNIYQLSYGEVTENGSVACTRPSSKMSKIVMHLGHSENQCKTKISLSGAIIITHHKQPLKEVVQAAHAVLDGVAKDKSGRNSLAIRLMKRSGGIRDVWFNWEEENIFADEVDGKRKTVRESFLDVIKNAGNKLTPSLLYKIENLKESFEPLVNDIESNKELIERLFEYEIAHSIYSRKQDASKANILAKDLAGICIKVRNVCNNKNGNWYNPEAAIIANFMAKAGVETDENGGEGNE